jgi:uncharacterized protein YraI
MPNDVTDDIRGWWRGMTWLDADVDTLHANVADDIRGCWRGMAWLNADEDTSHVKRMT